MNNFWMYNFQKHDWEWLSSCESCIVAKMLLTLTVMHPNMWILESGEKPAFKLKF